MGDILVSQLWAWVLAGCTALVSITKAVEIVKKWGNKKDIMHKLDNDNRRIQKLEDLCESQVQTNKIVLQTLLAIVDHSIDGNGIDNLKKIRGELQKHLIEH